MSLSCGVLFGVSLAVNYYIEEMISLWNRRNWSICFKICTVAFIVCVLFVAIKPPYTEASSNSWEDALTKIDQLYDSLTSLEAVNKRVKEQTQQLRKQNNDKLKAVNQQIKLIDKNKIDKLKTAVDQAQKKHAPLLAEYTELGRKAAEARKNKNKKSALMYDLKRNRIKASATAARQEIKLKKDSLTAAKSQASAKAKIVKDTLLPIQMIKKQIATENSNVTDMNKIRVTADKRYKLAIKQGDAIIAASELKRITSELDHIQRSQNKIHEWEIDIQNTIRAAEVKLLK